MLQKTLKKTVLLGFGGEPVVNYTDVSSKGENAILRH